MPTSKRAVVATAMPIPPCLIRHQRYPRVRFGFCSVGTASPNVTIDPLGNVRSCNLSSAILGNNQSAILPPLQASPAASAPATPPAPVPAPLIN